MQSKKFALIGAAGYIAPRHMEAIKATKNKLVVAYDPNDSVGILDTHFPDTVFFTEFEDFDRYVGTLLKCGEDIDYVAIASPNYLHEEHIRFALKNNAHAVCEKPLVLSVAEIDALKDLETKCGFKVFTILQLRLHPSIIELKQNIERVTLAKSDEVFEVELTYLTSRGDWYLKSWKGDSNKSGGIAANIGVHFFDMLGWIFGDVVDQKVFLRNQTVASGVIVFEHAKVRWFLSTDYEFIPHHIKEKGQRTFRSITVSGEEIEFSGGFTDLHTASYEAILAGDGFGLDDARRSIELVEQIGISDILPPEDGMHFLARPALTHE